MVFDKVREIVRASLGIRDDVDITADTALVEDLGAESLDVVDMVMAFEEEFDIEIPDDTVLTFNTIGDIVRYLEETV